MDTTDKLSLSFLNDGDIVFSHNGNGFLVMTLAGEEKGRINLKRSYPYAMPDEYICVLDTDDKEIGIIRDINNLDSASYEEAKKELELRYYCPVITEIKSVKEKMGHFYFDTVCEKKRKNFTVRNITSSIRFIRDDTLLIFDMDGNRYIIENFSKTETKSRKLLEPYLY